MLRKTYTIFSKRSILPSLGRLLTFVFMIAMAACGGDSDEGAAPPTNPPSGGSGDTEQSEGANQEPAVEGPIAYAMSLGVGWNLGNNLDAYVNGVSNETCWGNSKATLVTMKAVKAAGFKSVRIPVTWMGHIGNAPYYTIEKAWMDRVAVVAGYAKQAGLKAIINIHHDGSANDGKPTPGAWLTIKEAASNPETNTAIKDKLSKVWTQIATRFKNEGDWLIFETMNEIHDGNWGYPAPTAQLNVLNEWNQIAVNAIRSVGGENTNRYIGIPGYCTNVSLTIANLAMPTDIVKDRIMVAVHSYDPYDYACAANTDTWNDEKSLTNILKSLHDRFVSKGTPVYIGEFGCVHRANAAAEETRKRYLKFYCSEMRKYNIPAIVWDNGSQGTGNEAFGLIKHGDGTYINNGKDIVEIMVNAFNN